VSPRTSISFLGHADLSAYFFSLVLSSLLVDVVRARRRYDFQLVLARHSYLDYDDAVNRFAYHYLQAQEVIPAHSFRMKFEDPVSEDAIAGLFERMQITLDSATLHPANGMHPIRPITVASIPPAPDFSEYRQSASAGYEVEAAALDPLVGQSWLKHPQSRLISKENVERCPPVPDFPPEDLPDTAPQQSARQFDESALQRFAQSDSPINLRTGSIASSTRRPEASHRAPTRPPSQWESSTSSSDPGQSLSLFASPRIFC
jgi:hypothetical protein